MADQNKKYVSSENLLYIWQKIKTLLLTKVDVQEGKGLSTNDFTTDDKTNLNNISNYIENNLKTWINEIEGLIPDEATSSNKLADREFVNSSIATNTAVFRGTYETTAQLPTKSDISDLRVNDYAFVITTSNGNPEYQRYKYTNSGWVFEYTLNNSSFTSEQWEAINSKMTSALTTQITTNKNSISTLSLNKEDKANLKALAYKDSLSKCDVGLGNVDNTSDAAKPISNATQAALNLKEDKANLKALAYKASLSKNDVGLGNVDNTSDAAKPISTATQAALDTKASASTVTSLTTTVSGHTTSINYLNNNAVLLGTEQKITAMKDFDQGLKLGSGVHNEEYTSSLYIHGGIYSNPNLNNISQRGIFYCEGGTNVPNFENYSVGYYTLMVFNSGGFDSQGRGDTMTTQMVVSQNKWWIRWKWDDADSWNSWEKFGLGDEIDQLTNTEIDTIFAS